MRSSRISRFICALLAVGALSTTIGCVFPRSDGRYEHDHHEGDHDHDHDHGDHDHR